MHDLYIWALLLAGLLIFISSLDDLLIDVLAFVRRRQLVDAGPASSASQGGCTPKVAIFIANWQEADVLPTMVAENLAAISYRPLVFVLGVYPNDAHTLKVARQLADQHPELVEVVVNRRAGPTSKGQMLNEMFLNIYSGRESVPDLVVLHDSEDIIDPRSFAVYADRASQYALIQIPVFSLDSRRRSMVGATYMEEFAERHSREMIVRKAVGSFIPSAGVGTAIRKDLILRLLTERGAVLHAGSVTEDYILGAEAHRRGFRTDFAFVRAPSAAGPATVIATFEYFPKTFRASVRQKARWVYGIVFDGTARLGWSGTWWDRFFLYRDRKGAVTNLLPPVGLALLCMAPIVGGWSVDSAPPLGNVLPALLIFNSAVVAVRLYVRVTALRQVYRISDLGGVLLRWPIAALVNALATVRAWATFVGESGFASRPIAWAKTQHELPARFEAALGLATVRRRAWQAALPRSLSSGLSISALVLLVAYAATLHRARGLLDYAHVEVASPTSDLARAETEPSAHGNAPPQHAGVALDAHAPISSEMDRSSARATGTTPPDIASELAHAAPPAHSSQGLGGPSTSQAHGNSAGHSAADLSAPSGGLPEANASGSLLVVTPSPAQATVTSAITPPGLPGSSEVIVAGRTASPQPADQVKTDQHEASPSPGLKTAAAAAKWRPDGKRLKATRRPPASRRPEMVVDAGPPIRLNWGAR